ncbi:MAG: response regulator [Campylobacterota bacterium]|nr:response regulator [Campylobacterota bacterium]
MKVMIIDDSKTILKVLNSLLTNKIEQSLDIVECNSGEEAIKNLLKNDLEIDLILLDVVMNGIDGYETCQIIKTNTETEDIPIMFLTSKNEEKDILKGFEVGGVDYIFKPFREAEFIARVQLQLKLIEFKKQEFENVQSEVLLKVGEIGESRSKETANHVKRVAEYSYLLAKLYGMDEKEAKTLYGASPMHDIGKVSVPDAILNKPSWLTDDEIKEMQKHTTAGYDLFKNSKGAILKAASIVSHEHHEKYDGTGYPRKLKGKKIHIYGRITALVDVFDALGSDRVYKKAWEFKRIKKLFKEERGKHFDPKLVDLFLENSDKFKKIRNKFKDIKE